IPPSRGLREAVAACVGENQHQRCSTKKEGHPWYGKTKHGEYVTEASTGGGESGVQRRHPKGLPSRRILRDHTIAATTSISDSRQILHGLKAVSDDALIMTGGNFKLS
ncbi:MAG: hypothetical protein WB755_06815, partial [Terriglobales bacterium]